MVERSCGQVVESFGYNEHNGRLEETRRSCQRRPTKFTYAKPSSQRVSEYHNPYYYYFSSLCPTNLFWEGRGQFSIYVDHEICGEKREEGYEKKSPPMVILFNFTAS